MADQPLHIAPVFLSASIPDPARDPQYFSTGDTLAIRDAVIALVTVTLPRTTLVFGGHPAITPMVKWVADQMGAFDRVHMYQSRFFRDRYLKDIERFRYREIGAVDRDEAASLKAMRLAMIGSEDFGAAFFIGGMEGVEREYELMKEERSGVPRYPVYTTGAAARKLWGREWELARDDQRPRLADLRRKRNYTGLFTGILEDPAPAMAT
jgi:hypothetical protein